MKTIEYTSKIVRNLDYTRQILNLWKTNLPYIQPFFAIKSCPDIELLHLCSEENVGFDFASMKELELVKNITTPDNTIFANPTKSIHDIKYAVSNNHNRYVIDSIEELIKINNIEPDAKYIIRIVSNETFSAIKFNSKFGICIEQYEKLLEYMSQNNINLEGISYHVGSKCTNMKAHNNTIQTIIDEYIPRSINYGLMPKIIDIGGGFENGVQILELKNELEPLLQTLENNNIRLIAEPGRLLSSGIFDIYTKIIAIRERIINDIKTIFITINDSVYHTFQGKIFDGQLYEPISLLSTNANKEQVRCVIFGQTCDSLDVICENVILPYPELGDILMFKNIGAYSLASCSGNFNGFSYGSIETL